MGIKEISSVFKALGDPIRRDILKYLRKRPMTPTELGSKFRITQPSLSHHLNTLKSANLIDSERQGQQILYSLNTTVFYDLINDFLNGFK